MKYILFTQPQEQLVISSSFVLYRDVSICNKDQENSSGVCVLSPYTSLQTAWRRRVWMIGKQGEWCMIGVWRFVRGNAWGIAQGMNPWPWWDATALWSPGWVEIRLQPSPQLKSIKRNISFWYLLYLLIFYFHSFHRMMHADPVVMWTGW